MRNTVGCFAVIEDEKHNILLVKRKDFPLWDLPGGRQAMGETLEECVLREVKEETGCDVEIDYLIGEFSRPSMNDIQYIYACRIVGGTLIHDGVETKKLKYCNPTFLPAFMVANRKKQIQAYRRGCVRIEETLHDQHVFSRLQRMFNL